MSLSPTRGADGGADALAKLAEIPLAGSEERNRWMDFAEQHGFQACCDAPLFTATARQILTLMSQARKQGQRDVLAPAPTAGGSTGGGCSLPDNFEDRIVSEKHSLFPGLTVVGWAFEDRDGGLLEVARIAAAAKAAALVVPVPATPNPQPETEGETGRDPDGSGSRPSDQVAAHPAPAAFDPSRGPADDDIDRHERGRVVWHSSEEDGGPDVGLTFGLGERRFLWLGEISDQQHAEAGEEAANVGTADGRWLVLYDESKPRGAQAEVLGKVVGQEAVQTLCLAFARFGNAAADEARAEASADGSGEAGDGGVRD